ncbi:MAG: hypothetical protein D6759_03655 [Chloroflexi bacterium]|nr:MAG: hypothetical protein D6759_03655 [Chloroflexota bacterium]
MAEPPPRPPVSTFVIRFWHEWSAAGPRWRGRIEHVQSGEGTTFLDLEGLLDFVRRFGVMESERSPSQEENLNGETTSESE